MALSVLICSYNRPQLLRKALEGLLNKTTEPPDEVVLVNGGGKDTQDAVLPLLGRTSPLRIVNTTNVSLARSQNIGLAECHGDMIALTDDDAIVAPDWCTMIKKVFEEHPEASAVGGPVRTLFPDNQIARLAHFTTFTEPEFGTYVRTIAGVNICYRRAAIDLVGELDETLVSSEEVDYNWRLVKTGSKIWWDPRIKVFHHDRTTLKALLYQQFFYGRGYFQTRRKWPDIFNLYPRGLRTRKDILKILYFFPGIIIGSLSGLGAVTRWDDRFMFPWLRMMAGVAHRVGYLNELFRWNKRIGD